MSPLSYTFYQTLNTFLCRSIIPASSVSIPMRFTVSPIQFMDAFVKSFEDRYPIPSIIIMETRNITAAVRVKPVAWNGMKQSLRAGKSQIPNA